MSRPPFVNFDGLPQKLSDALARIQQLLRGGLNLHDHFTRSHIKSYQHTAGAGTAQTIDITALKIPWPPTMFIVVDIDLAGTVHATAADKAAWTSTSIVLRCSTNNTNLKVMVF